MPKQSIPVLAALNPSTTFNLDLTNASSSARTQTTLALYRPPSSASSAQGILYEIVKLDHQDAEPSKYMTYALWQGSDDDYYEFQNHEDPYAGYLIQKTWEDGDEVRYKGITTGFETDVVEDAEIKVYPYKGSLFNKKYVELGPTNCEGKPEYVLQAPSSSDDSDPMPPSALIDPSSRDLKNATWIIHVAPNMDIPLAVGLICAVHQTLETCQRNREAASRVSHIRRSMRNIRLAASTSHHPQETYQQQGQTSSSASVTSSNSSASQTRYYTHQEEEHVLTTEKVDRQMDTLHYEYESGLKHALGSITRLRAKMKEEWNAAEQVRVQRKYEQKREREEKQKQKQRLLEEKDKGKKKSRSFGVGGGGHYYGSSSSAGAMMFVPPASTGGGFSGCAGGGCGGGGGGC